MLTLGRGPMIRACCKQHPQLSVLTPDTPPSKNIRTLPVTYTPSCSRDRSSQRNPSAVNITKDNALEELNGGNLFFSMSSFLFRQIGVAVNVEVFSNLISRLIVFRFPLRLSHVRASNLRVVPDVTCRFHHDDRRPQSAR